MLADELLIDVFANLIGNSIKHSGGKETIDIKLSKVSSNDDHGHYLVTIEDNGPGISDELKDKIFNRYLRGDTKARGSGIGLYLVKALIDSYSGKVWVEDRIRGDSSKGNKFIVILSAAQSNITGRRLDTKINKGHKG